MAGFAAALGLIFGQRTLREARDAGRMMVRLEGGRGPAARTRRVPILQGPAQAFSRRAWGAKLAARTARDHPGVAFSDVLAFGLCAVTGGALAGALIFGAPVPAVGLSLVSPFILDRFFIRLHGSRGARMERQLPAALALQAAALRAGQSLVGSLRIVGAASKAPLGEEMGRTLHHIDLGTPLEEAVEQFAARSCSGDVDLWVNSMLIHRQTGGNLAGVIDAMADRITQRGQMRGEIRALTAQGRLSGLVVAAAPVVFFVLLSVGSREQMKMLYTTPLGWVLLVTGLTLNGLGLVWIRCVTRIRP